MPTLFGSATLPAVPVGPTPFTRKNWDNPIRYKLNRSYGDEFEYQSFAELTRRWKVLSNAVAADFDFPTGSSIAWKMANNASNIAIPAPSGDFEAVLEFSLAGYLGIGGGDSDFAPCITLTDSVGTGAAGAYYGFGPAVYGTVLTTFNTGASNNLAVTAVYDGRRAWLAVRRTGTSLQSRFSSDGSTFSALTTGVTVSATAPYLGIGKCYPSAAVLVGYIALHRLNVYPGPTFFPG